MPCYHPIQAYYSASVNASGKRGVVFSRKGALVDRPVSIPCGRCVGCRLEHSRQWAVRCIHEASLYRSNCFITLTYSDAYLPSSGSLNISHFQKFMKRLRKKFGSKIRFFHCGEYGEMLGRPHYHACLFNFDFPDKKLLKESGGVKLYTSAALESLWSDPITGEPYGFCTIGDVSFESAAYVARYVLKKVNGPLAAAHYQGRAPEYVTMSRRPGIGAGWFEKFKSDAYPSDFLIIRDSVRVRPPRYYDGRYEIIDPEGLQKIKAKRVREGKKFLDNSSPERLAVREECTYARLNQLKRTIE